MLDYLIAVVVCLIGLRLTRNLFKKKDETHDLHLRADEPYYIVRDGVHLGVKPICDVEVGDYILPVNYPGNWQQVLEADFVADKSVKELEKMVGLE